jgi:hypothetical protein
MDIRWYTHESPLGEIVGIASEHDAVAGTERAPNTIFRFVLDGKTVPTSATSASRLYAPDAFLHALGARLERLEESEAELDSLPGSREDPVVVLLAPPLATRALS